jgi:hypothetical protein
MEDDMDRFMAWFRTYNTEITWFIIGMMLTNAIVHLANGKLGLAVVDLVLAGINYHFWRTSK